MPGRVLAAIVLAASLGLRPSPLAAQDVATVTIRVTVTPADAIVTIINEATGHRQEDRARAGIVVIHGLEPGGPYSLFIRRIGFRAHESHDLYLTLGHPLELSRSLQRTTLDTVHVAAKQRVNGVATSISDSLLHRLPTLNRDMYDFAKFAPQISTKVGLAVGGVSGGGVNVRFNQFLIDGAPDRVPVGNSSTASGGAKSVPIEAVREYQVLLAPYDVRFGDFAGALVNTVTMSGTNTFHASAFVANRSDGLARSIDTVHSPYDRTQYGLAAGGPLVRDHLHFFLATEFQRLSQPAPGPFLGQSSSASSPAPVNGADVARFASRMSAYGLDPGSSGAVTNQNPLANLFARLDFVVPALRTRGALIESDESGNTARFSRPSTDTFSLSSYRVAQVGSTALTSLQLRSNLGRGWYNALTLSLRRAHGGQQPEVREPLVLVLVPGASGGTAVIKAGSQEGGQGVSMQSHVRGLTETLTLPLNRTHEVVLGGQVESVRLDRGGVNNGYGTWTFASLDAFDRGIPDRYLQSQDLGSVGVPLRAVQYALYAGDDWHASERLSLSAGVRGDALALVSHSPYNADVDRLFGRRTDRNPAARMHLSPRIGVTWDPFGNGRDELRAGVGVFTGRYPLAWAHTVLYSYGSGIGTLQCGGPNDPGLAPAFVPDYRAAPSVCANGKGLANAPRGDVDLLDPHLRLAQSLRGSLAWERQLPGNVISTAEAMITRGVSEFAFVNLKLVGPQGVDRRGRTLYGTVAATGVATPALIGDAQFTEVVDVRNVAAGHSLQLDWKLERQFSRGFSATASYTFSRVRDVGLPLRAGMPGRINWMSQRVVSGRHDEWATGVSQYEIPHRVVVAGTYATPWRRLTTDVSLYYIGESGSPFTYVAGGAQGRGDLNADGALGNDPLYIPTSATDTSQIRFAAGSAAGDTPQFQQAAFEQFIAGTPCLREQRGQIMRRNSCREPWSHTSIASIRQALPPVGSHTMTLQIDVFNILNLLNSRWGLYRVADPNFGSPALLSQVGETSGPSPQPIFYYNASAPKWATLTTESSYQLQFALRYSF